MNETSLKELGIMRESLSVHSERERERGEDWADLVLGRAVDLAYRQIVLFQHTQSFSEAIAGVERFKASACGEPHMVKAVDLLESWLDWEFS